MPSNPPKPDLTITLYGEIGESFWGDGVTAKEVADQLAQHPDAEAIDVRINSPGGSVFDGSAIHALLRQHPAKVTTRIDGVAASAASMIAMAGDTIEISEAGFLMIHEASGLTVGRASDHHDTGHRLTQINGVYAGVYAARSGMKRDDVLDVMSAETWYTGEQAVEAGFADSVVTGPAGGAAVATVATARYRNTPERLVAPQQPQRFHESYRPASVWAHQRNEIVSALPEQLVALLGCEANDGAILVAVRAALADRGELETIKATLVTSNARVTELVAELEKFTLEQREAECQALIVALCDEGAITKGGSHEKLLRELYAEGKDALAKQIAATYRESAPKDLLGQQSRARDRVGSHGAGTQEVRLTAQAAFELLPAATQIALGALNKKPLDLFKTNPELLPDGVAVEDLAA